MLSKVQVVTHGQLRPALLLAALCVAGCGGNLSEPYYPGYYGGNGSDGGMCGYANGGSYACGCVDRPYALAVSMATDNTGALKDLDVSLAPADRIAPSTQVTPPAKGTPGANAYWVATVMSSDGEPLTSLVFAGTRSVVDASYHHGHGVDFAVGLAPGAAILHIESWDTGQVLVDLDLRGHLQLLCIDRPCLSLCSASSARDAAQPVPPDASPAAGEGGTVDAPAADEGTDAGAPGNQAVDAGT